MTLHDPYSVEPRKPLTSKQRLKLFLERNGICCICGHKIETLKPWIDEHIIPLWLGGSNDLSNRGVAHERCARVKTAKEATERASIRKKAERHFGAHTSKHPMPCGRKSKWKKKMNGEVVPR
jgi:5-methylcytosine-specific restriction endonuclease McrA